MTFTSDSDSEIVFSCGREFFEARGFGQSPMPDNVSDVQSQCVCQLTVLHSELLGGSQWSMH